MADKLDNLTNEELYDLAQSFYFGEDGSPQNYSEAARLMKLAADRGDALSICEYGVYLMNGDGVEKDEQAAVEYWQKAADMGLALAHDKLGACYLAGLCGLPQSEEKAFEAFTKAAEGGNPDAMFRLAYFYQNGVVVKQDLPKAVALLQQAAELKQPMACYSLGMLTLIGGTGLVETDEPKGFELLQYAAEQKIAEAQFMVGMCCETGRGTEKDLATAAGWYRRAAKGGFEQANEALQRLGFPPVM